MPATRNRFKCGHLGRGTVCRRCLQATTIETQANGMPEGSKRNELLDEAMHLRSVEKKSSFTLTEST